MKIVPGILVHTLKDLKEKLKLVSWAEKVHIDIMDGKFVPNKTIQALTLKKAIPAMDMQIHLMAYKPHTYIDKFARLGAKEFIFHAESTKHAAETLEEIKLKGMKAGIAFNPETKVNKDLLIHADMALVMTVPPGFSGQEMLKKPLNKIKHIKECNPLIQVGIDGGVNLHTCRFFKADFAIAAGAIMKAKNPRKAYEQLLKRCR